MTLFRAARLIIAALAVPVLVACADQASSPLAPSATAALAKGGGRSDANAGRVFNAVRRRGAKWGGLDRARIGPEGGRLSAGGATLTIPPGALEKDAHLLLIVPSGPYLTALLYPHGLTFEKDVTLSFDLSEVDDRRELLGVYIGEDDVAADGQVRALETAPVKHWGQLGSIEIGHFSAWTFASGYSGGRY